MSRKYKRGKIITSLEEFANQNMIWDNRTNKVYHNGWVQSWQLRHIKIGIANGWFSIPEQLKENL